MQWWWWRRKDEQPPRNTKESDLSGDGVVLLIAGGVFQFLLDRRERIRQRTQSTWCACENSPFVHPRRGYGDEKQKDVREKREKDGKVYTWYNYAMYDEHVEKLMNEIVYWIWSAFKTTITASRELHVREKRSVRSKGKCIFHLMITLLCSRHHPQEISKHYYYSMSVA